MLGFCAALLAAFGCFFAIAAAIDDETRAPLGVRLIFLALSVAAFGVAGLTLAYI